MIFRRKEFVIPWLVSIVVSMSILFMVYYKTSRDILKPTSLINNTQQSIEKTYKQWVSCPNSRGGLEDDGKKYTACTGGLLIMDPKTGQILDQITQTDGLSGIYTGSLVKKDNFLYIGSYGGVTIFDVTTKRIKRLSVDQGLVGGSNVELTLDGEDLWVGTSDGVSLYNTKTGELRNFQSELEPSSTIFSSTLGEITENSVFVYISSNVGSPGAVARWDKNRKRWDSWNYKTFGLSSPYDLFGVAIKEINNEVYAIHKNWIKKWSDEERIWKDFLENSDEIRKTFVERQKRIADSISNQVDNNKQDLLFSNRPRNFDRVLATIDGKPIFLSDGWVWEYDSANDSFIKLFEFSAADPDYLGFSEFDSLYFRAIPESSDIFFFYQARELDPHKPKIKIFDYKNKVVKNVDIPQAVLSKLRDLSIGEYAAFGQMRVSWVDSYAGSIGFELSRNTSVEEGKKTEYVKFDLKDSSWKFMQYPVSGYGAIHCANSYKFLSNENRFSGTECDFAEQIEKNGYTFLSRQNNELLEFTKNSKKWLELIPLAGLKEYRPLDSNLTTDIREILIVDNYLWVRTNRGLSYLNLDSQKWYVLDYSRGFIDNDVKSFVVDNGVVWVSTEGGLASVNYKLLR